MSRETVLIAEPDALTRWSLQAYLTRWFEVQAAATVEDAARMLADVPPVAAIVVSDSLRKLGFGVVETRARLRNPAVRVICTVADLGATTAADRWSAASQDPQDSRAPGLLPATYVEKPFDLSRLAVLLGASAGTAAREPGSR